VGNSIVSPDNYRDPILGTGEVEKVLKKFKTFFCLYLLSRNHDENDLEEDLYTSPLTQKIS
jgi:hypothetical protein